MRNFVFIVVCLLSAWCVNASDIATKSLTYYRDAARANLPRLRAELRRGLTPNQAKIEQSIIYTVSMKGELNAHAFMREDGRRQIEIDAGLVQFADWFEINLAVGTATRPNQACSTRYLMFLIDGINNSRFVPQIEGWPAPVSGNPIDFLRSHPDTCPAPESLPTTHPGFEKNEFVDILIKYALGHELAHHLLGHVLKESEPKAESREDEIQADRFALRLLAKSGGPAQVIPATGILVLLAGADDYTMDGESFSDHPAGVRRIKMFVSAWREVLNDPEIRMGLQRNGQLQNTLAAAARAERQIDALLKSHEHEAWFVSMVQYRGQAPPQAVLHLSDIPSEHLAAFLHRGYSILSVAESAGTWRVVLDKGAFGEQRFTISNEFPAEFVKQRWKEGFEITTLASDGVEWVLVMSKNSRLTSQRWKISSSFPTDYVRDALSRGEFVTGLGKVGKTYGVVTSRTPEFTSQSYNCSTTGLPQDFVKAKRAEGYFLTTALPLEGQGWCVVLSKTSRYSDQQNWITGTSINAETKDWYNKKFRVLTIY
jgi:hypothetical protein